MRSPSGGGKGLAIVQGLGLEGGELRIEGDEREDEGLEGRVQDGKRGELWVCWSADSRGSPSRSGGNTGPACVRSASARAEAPGGGTWPSGHGHRSLRAATTSGAGLERRRPPAARRRAGATRTPEQPNPNRASVCLRGQVLTAHTRHPRDSISFRRPGKARATRW
jgi:hypothetical protein